MSGLAVILFLAGAGFAFYIVAGYPLLLALLAWWKPQPIRKRFTDPLKYAYRNNDIAALQW